MKAHNYFNGILLVASWIVFSKADNDTAHPKLELQMLNILFRHGDRVPRKNSGEMYPTDPNYNTSFFPLKYGDLTDKGKNMSFIFGKTLRAKYNDFLGPDYIFKDVSARSTKKTRTEMSLKLALTGLYSDMFKNWDPSVPLQQIEINNVKPSLKSILKPGKSSSYKRLLKKVLKLPEVTEKLATFIELWRNLSRYTKKDIRLFQVLNLYNTIIAELSMGLNISDFARVLYDNHELQKAVSYEIHLKNYNEDLRKLRGGILLRKMFMDMWKLKSNITLGSGNKMNLYCAHESNVASLLLSLGVTQPHCPYFTSAVILEFYRDWENNHYVQVLYYKGDTKEMDVMKIPNCSLNNAYKMCKFEDYLSSICKEIICE